MSSSNSNPEQKRAEEELTETASRLNTLLDNLQDGVLFEDEQRQILFINRRFCELYHIPAPPQALIGSDCREAAKASAPLFMDPGSFLRRIEEVVSEGKTVSGEELLLVDGRVMERDYAPIMISGQRHGHLWKFRDVTERRRLEEELLKAQKLESIGVLAGGIAHDFNNLLTAIMGNISLSLYQVPQNSAIERRLSDAVNACEQARDLSYRLLTFSKGGEPMKKQVAPAGLLRDVAGLSLSGSNVTADFNLPEDLFPVLADEGQLKQVINNLVLNAREAMPCGGTVRIAACNVSLDRENGHSQGPGDFVRITISDQGPGISEENQARIFDPYFTTKEFGAERGRGLGLAICHSIIRKHGGRISVESRSGAGAAFHVFLPAVAPATAARAVLHGSDKEPPQRKHRILVMDDEDRVRSIVREMLEFFSYDVEDAPDGRAAVELYASARSQGKPFDLVLLDLTVPGGMGGVDTVRRLREIDPEVRAIVSSGYVEDPILKDFRDYGFSSAIAKPYDVSRLGEVIEQALKPAGAQQPDTPA